MKTRIMITTMCCIAVSFIMLGCTSNYLEYDHNLSALGFKYQNGKDSMVYSFTLHSDKEKHVVEIPFHLMGYASQTDRLIGIEVDKEATTAVEGKDFIIEKTILPAGAFSGTLPVIVKNSKDLEQKDLIISLRLRDNENFSSPLINESRFRIILTNQLTKPEKWPFNEYSRVKHEFVIKVTGIGTDYDKWSGQELVYWTGILTKALYEYNKNHPDDLLKDENGLLITF